MKNIIVRNAKAVFDICEETGYDLSVAPDLFADNLTHYPERGVAIHKGADVDYKTLSEEWAKMTKDEQIAAGKAFDAMIADHRHDLGNAYKAKDWDTFNKILGAWV